MNFLESIALGLVQGLTEWLPVSSSGHLALAQRSFGETSVAFDVVLHIATVIVACIFFWGDIKAIVLDWLRGIRESFGQGESRKALFGRRERLWGWLIILACVPTAIIGYLIDKYLAGEDFNSLSFLAAGFIVTGVFLAITMFAKPRGKALGSGEAAAVGTAQGIAVFSSISRSGLTVGTGLLMGISAEDAGKFSFLVLIPATIGAMVLKVNDIGALATSELGTMVAGAVSAAIVGYMCLGAMMRIVRGRKLHWFAPYCIILGIVLLAFAL